MKNADLVKTFRQGHIYNFCLETVGRLRYGYGVPKEDGMIAKNVRGKNLYKMPGDVFSFGEGVGQYYGFFNDESEDNIKARAERFIKAFHTPGFEIVYTTNIVQHTLGYWWCRLDRRVCLPKDEVSNGHSDDRCYAAYYGWTEEEVKDKAKKYFECFPPQGYMTYYIFPINRHAKGYWWCKLGRIHSCE